MTRPRRYAEETTVPVDRTKAEIERTLQRYGASGFFSGWDTDPPRASIGFRIDGRMVRMQVVVPGSTQRRTEQQVERAHRRVWRVLLLVVKAKLEAVECGLSTVEREFMADIVMADGRTIGDWAAPEIARMYETGRMPPLLGTGSGGDQ